MITCRDAYRPTTAFRRRGHSACGPGRSGYFVDSPTVGERYFGPHEHRHIVPGRIEDYALIGDCRTAALVCRDGSIDWLCFPRFDSGACFAALLGTPENGRWQLAPKADVRRVRRRYRTDSLVLETEFETGSGRITLIDWMAPGSHGPHLFRMLRGESGEVVVGMDLVIRFDYGSIVPWVRRTQQGIRAVAGPDTLQLFTRVNVHGENMHTRAEFSVRAGDEVGFELAWSPTYGPLPTPSDIQATRRDTDRAWRNWAGRCRYAGEWREAVVRRRFPHHRRQGRRR